MAFTSGDPSGIGPECVAAALRRVGRFCRPLLVGEASVWCRAGWREGLAELRDTGLGLKPPAFGRVTKEGGAASFAAVEAGVRLVREGHAGGLFTGPISKEAWRLAGVPHRDHTEYLRAETGSPGTQMVLGSPARNLWCVLATRHIPLARVPEALSVSIVAAAGRSLHEALRKLGVRKPRLGLCALNPHAGEAGLLGSEEKLILAPAAAALRRGGMLIEGPLPADAAWRSHAAGGFDGLVALYHDQALIPLKALAGLAVVNWTTGLPFVRVSPGHGTAFDIAGSGRADPAATISAARLAARLCAAEKTTPA